MCCGSHVGLQNEFLISGIHNLRKIAACDGSVWITHKQISVLFDFWVKYPIFTCFKSALGRRTSLKWTSHNLTGKLLTGDAKRKRWWPLLHTPDPQFVKNGTDQKDQRRGLICAIVTSKINAWGSSWTQALPHHARAANIYSKVAI